jgi:hypothetical protein
MDIYSNNKQIITLNEIKEILDDIPTIALEDGYDTRDWTYKIKDRFAELGKARGYEVCYSEKKSNNDKNDRSLSNWGEWLYDLTWLKGDYPEDWYSVKSCPLILESEWGGYGEIIEDFSKLLVSNSPHRVMIFEAHNIEKKEKFISRLKLDADGYGLVNAGAKFYFVCYQRWDRKFAYEEFEVL